MAECNYLEILSDKKVLCVEDEEVIRSNLMETLELFFDKVSGAKDGFEALEQAMCDTYDVFIFDISIPHLDGLEVLKRVRQFNKKTPIIILSAHKEQEYLWRAVELKITRYLTKPYDKNSLIKALEEAALELMDYHPLFQISPLHSYDFCRKAMTCKEEMVYLSKSESRLLEYFLRHANQTITYEQISEYMWEFEQPTKEAIKSIVKELRKKIDNSFIKNLYGIGYLFEV